MESGRSELKSVDGEEGSEESRGRAKWKRGEGKEREVRTLTGQE